MPRFGRCDICLGRGTINLPVYRETTACAVEPGPRLLDDLSMEPSDDNARSYPCPECAKPNIPMDVGDRFTVIRVNSLLQPELIQNSGYMSSVRGSLAHRIAQVMLKSGGITFAERRSPRDGGWMSRPGSGPPMVMEAVAGIVWPEGREIERIIENFDPVFNDGSRSGGVASGRNDYPSNDRNAFADPSRPDPYDDYRRDDPDVGVGMKRSQTRKPPKPPNMIKLQRNPGRELIFEDEVKSPVADD